MKIILLVFAILIGFFSLWYTNNLVEKLANQEREKIRTWANATKTVASPDFQADDLINFFLEIIENNNTIPVILVDSSGAVISSRNIDSSRYNREGGLDYSTLINDMAATNEPIYLEGQNQIVYFENSTILKQLRIYPYFQLGIISLFLAISYFAFSYSRKSEQNKVWAGMSKETAHQLGTPISSLMGWLDYIRESEGQVSEKVVSEIENDLNRLGLITDRFSKIGSEPVLKKVKLLDVLKESVDYINSRTSDKVNIRIEETGLMSDVVIFANKPLFAWVVENLCKNAVDAMKGEGSIVFHYIDGGQRAIIDVTDSGCGIPSNKFKTVFKPGYTSKKRGWGLGLSLVKRIIENYHGGKIFVKWSEIGSGTTFRIELKKQ